LDAIDGVDYAEAVMSSSSAREHVFTFEEYVRIAEDSAIRLEFWDGTILDMPGGTPRHSAICSNIAAILRTRLRGSPCRPYDSNLKIRSTVVNRATYPDAAVVCGPLEMDPADRTRQTVLNPTVLFEILSPSTEADDRGPKLDCYRTIASVTAVVHVSQDERRVVVHERRADGAWSQAVHTSGAIDLVSAGCTLPLDEIYEDLPD
jgi:Uma2 family endonuclease